MTYLASLLQFSCHTHVSTEFNALMSKFSSNPLKQFVPVQLSIHVQFGVVLVIRQLLSRQVAVQVAPYFLIYW